MSQQLTACPPTASTLPQPFYTDEQFFQLDLTSVWRQGWLFAAHRCELPEEGDYVTFDLAGDSLILWHSPGGRIEALFNTCRHRGMQLCDAPSGRASRLVCPYHRWRYGPGGRLLAAPGMGPEFNVADYSLARASVREVAGLIFVSYRDTPADFSGAEEAIAPQLGPHDLTGTKVAHVLDYTVRANWKLIIENNRECYHCSSNHPEYEAATYDTIRDDSELQHELSARLDELRPRWQAAGLDVSAVNFSSDMTGSWFRANRTPLRPGFTTESTDGRLVGPLLGAFRDPEVGTCRVTTFPNFWCHASCDHAVTTRILPKDATTSLVRVTWLVRADAIEGKDYQLERLVPFWQQISEQDWSLCERQQAGVQSSRYQPGPYSSQYEANVIQFINWYLRQFEQGIDSTTRTSLNQPCLQEPRDDRDRPC